MLVASLVAEVAKKLQCSEAEVGRRIGAADPQRLYQWKTYRRRMPTRALYMLITLSGRNITNAIGQYTMEWESKQVHTGKRASWLDRG